MERELGALTRKKRRGGSLLLPGWPVEGQIGLPQWVSSTERNLGTWGLPALCSPSQGAQWLSALSQGAQWGPPGGRDREGKW